MTTTAIIVLAAIAGGFILLLVFVVRLFLMTRRLSDSFNKLGFVVREDAKKYFDDAAGKLVETNRQFKQQYERIVQESTRSSLVDSGVVMEKALADAQHEAGQIILKAQEEARQIVDASKQHARECYMQSLNQSVQALSWTLEQYSGKQLGISEHEQIISTLLQAYVDENRK